MDETRAALVERMASFPTRLDAAATSAGDPPIGEWSASDVVRHLVAVDVEVWHARLDQLADSDARPEWRHTEPPARPLPDPSLSAALAALAARRAETIARLRALNDAGWARSGVHETYGVLDVLGLVRLAVDHDDEHLASLERLGPTSEHDAPAGAPAPPDPT